MLNSIKHVEIIGQTALTMAYYEIYLSIYANCCISYKYTVISLLFPAG